MSKTLRIRFWSGVAVLSVAVILMVASLLSNQAHPLVGTVARELGRRVAKQLRIVPEITFYLDDSLDYVEHIDELLKK